MPRLVTSQPPTEVLVADDDFPPAPTDGDLVALKARLDEAEAAVLDHREALAVAIQAALDDGVTMTHVARTVGWSRQWCYNALTRWSPAS